MHVHQDQVAKPREFTNPHLVEPHLVRPGRFLHFDGEESGIPNDIDPKPKDYDLDGDGDDAATDEPETHSAPPLPPGF